MSFLACENSRPSSLPARVAFTRNATRAGREEGRLFSQAMSFQAHVPDKGTRGTILSLLPFCS